jgi:hypothetical protein
VSKFLLRLSRLIKTYQNLSRLINTYQDLSRLIKTYQDLSRLINTYQDLSTFVDKQWKPLNVITLGQRQTVNINQMITVTEGHYLGVIGVPNN